MKQEPPLSTKCREKFLVETMLIPEYQHGLGAKYARQLDWGSDQVTKQKLRVKFIPDDLTIVDEKSSSFDSVPSSATYTAFKAEFRRPRDSLHVSV